MSIRHWLNIAESISIACSVGGIVVTAITKQALFSVSPLTLALFLNFLNRQIQIEQLGKCSESGKVINLHNEFVSINNDYQSYKLEVQQKFSQFEEIILHLHQDYTDKNETVIQTIQQRLSDLEPVIDKFSKSERDIQELKQSLRKLFKVQDSINQRFLNLESLIDKISKSERDIQELKQSLGQLFNLEKSLNQRFSNLEILLKNLPKNEPSRDKRPKSVGEDKQKYDYSKLIQLLASQQWEKADRETAAKMIEIIEGEKDELKTKELKKFPVNQLEEIDKLWIHYSNGKFGFSVQQYIWTQLGGERGEFESDIYKKWAKKVGWRANSSWKKYDELEFTINAPIGHLPAVTLAWSSWGAAWCGDETVKLFSRLNYNSSTAEPQNKQDPFNIYEDIDKIKSEINEGIIDIKGGIIDIGNNLNNFNNLL